MKFHNWQTIALTLFIAAVALWLATACANGDSTIESQSIPATTATSTQTATLEPIPIPCKEDTMALTAAQQEAFINKHSDLLVRQPNGMGFGYGKLWTVQNGEVVELKNEDGTNKYGLNIQVSTKVDQSTLPESNRIPDCLDGVPINWIEHDEWIWQGDIPSEWIAKEGLA